MIVHQGHHLHLRGVAFQLPGRLGSVRTGQEHDHTPANKTTVQMSCDSASPCTAHKVSKVHTIVLVAIQTIQHLQNKHSLSQELYAAIHAQVNVEVATLGLVLPKKSNTLMTHK